MLPHSQPVTMYQIALTERNTPMTEPIISYDLSVYFNKKKALNNVTMHFIHEITALIGPSDPETNPCSVLSTEWEIKPEWTLTGAVSYNGHNVYEQIPLNLQEMEWSSNNLHPFPMSIHENVVYGLRINGIKIRAVLDQAVEEHKVLQSEEVKDRLHDSALDFQEQRLWLHGYSHISKGYPFWRTNVGPRPYIRW